MVITKPDIYIFYSTDSAGVQQLAVSLLSLVQSKGKTSTYRIYIGHKDIHKAEMDFLTAVVGPYSKCYIYFHNCIKYEEKFNILPIDGHIMGSYWPTPVFYWLLAAYFIKCERFIQLDIDTIIQNDLEELVEIYSPTAVAGVPDTYHLWRIENENSGLNEELSKKVGWLNYYKFFARRGDEDYSKYINTGVMVINMNKLKKFALLEIFKNANLLQLNDQDILNRFLTKEISNIPLKYNFCLHMFHHYELQASLGSDYHPLTFFKVANRDLYRQINQATIIHCSLRIKPDYFFNSKLLDIIEKFKSPADYIHTLWDLNTLDKNPIYLKMNREQRNVLTVLKKEWNEQIALEYPTKNNIYSYAYIKWGELWKQTQEIFENLD